jgi:hypothetical protein
MFMRKLIFLGIISAFLFTPPSFAKDDKPAFSTKTTLEKIAANPAARAVIDAELPGFTTHPMYEQFKTMSLEALDAMFPGVVPRERIDAVDKALRAIPADAAATEVAGGAESATNASGDAGQPAKPADATPPAGTETASSNPQR